MYPWSFENAIGENGVFLSFMEMYKMMRMGKDVFQENQQKAQKQWIKVVTKADST